MVRIIIEIDGTEATVTTQGGDAAAAAQRPEASGASVPSGPLAPAAGANDAGAAPAGPPESLAVPPPPPAAASPGSLDAGSAPGTLSEPRPYVTTEEGE
jgi:hypothetical protein